MDGITVGLFGSEPDLRTAFASSIAKKAEAEGLTVYHRAEGGRRVSFLDAPDYPERIQRCASIASIVDHGIYFYPRAGRLSAPDGELAVLVGSFGLPGSIEIFDRSATPDAARSSLKGTEVASYQITESNSKSPSFDISGVSPHPTWPDKGTLVYIDRAFTVKGVGTVALGFVLFGSVSIHDQLRPIPGSDGPRLDVRGIQVNDVNVETAGRGIRVGLSLRGIESKDLERSHWLDDGSLMLSDAMAFGLSKSQFYKLPIESREMHLQLPGELVTSKYEAGEPGTVKARLPFAAPTWNGMRAAAIDLNGGSLRVAGGLTCKF